MFASILKARPGRRDRLAFAELHLIARACLIAILAALLARLLWVLVTPVGPLGDWRVAAPRFLSDGARDALLSSYDPFPGTPATVAAGGESVTDLDLQLFGTLLNRGAGTGSAIIAGEDGVQQSFAVGDEVSPGVRLAEVAFDHVVLDRGGVREMLYLDGALPADTIEVPDTSSAAAGTEAAAQAMIPDFEFEPRRTGGKITGIRLPITTDPALLSVIGLRAGDVIVSVNDVPVDSQADIDQLKSSLKPAARIRLMVERGAQTVPIAVNL
ncbi:type II secretion system protein N [Sphingomicrobium arenosum]|uniref:type II secretion system protein N n=1 Tax=Sphingomicrobium arenosum TaxID=2233861 RepID=UPI002240FE7E|nr:type II secretion system protein N [Sphingomicrobium arenosum]